MALSGGDKDSKENYILHRVFVRLYLECVKAIVEDCGTDREMFHESVYRRR